MNPLTKSYFGNTVEQWILSIGATLLIYFLFLWVLRFVTRRLAILAARTDVTLDDLFVDLLKGTRWFVILAWCAVVGVQGLKFSLLVSALLEQILVLVSLIQVGIWGNRLISYWIGSAMKTRLESDAASATTMAGVRFISKLILGSVLLLVALDNLGVDITALVAGLGVGGIAVALALQAVLGDLFASLSIVLDKPFQIGDFIVIGEFLGTVEHIGLKTTRLRSLSGEQVIFSNADLLKSRIRNYKRMTERRVVFTVGVTYQATAEQLKRIPDMIRDVIVAQPSTRFDRSHFASFGDSALNFETAYYVLSGDFNRYMDIQQAINLEIYSRFENEGISFAYPTRTLHVVRGSDGGS